MCGIEIPDSVTGNDLSHAFTGQRGLILTLYFSRLGSGLAGKRSMGPGTGGGSGQTGMFMRGSGWKKEMPVL